MKFKESDRIYQVGKKKGQPVLVPDIKTTDDIPDKVKNFFDEGYTFLEQFVGKENIVYAEVHYDEDTPLDLCQVFRHDFLSKFIFRI